jgi:hypothetical protein
MAEHTESRRVPAAVDAAAAPAANETTVKLYSSSQVGHATMTQHYLYGIPAKVTDEGYPYIDAKASIVKANQYRRFPLLEESAYRKMLEDVSAR